MFTLAHISDVHLAPLPRPWPHQLLGPRIFGFVNWHVLGRKRHHRRETLDDLMAHLRQQPHDHLALTGDIVNIALPQEFERSRPWIESVGTPDDVSVVPGNHDAYVASPRGKGIETWRDYMVSNSAGADHVTSPRTEMHQGFPYVRLFGDIALVGVSSGVPTKSMVASGTLGQEQRDALEAALASLAMQDFCIVLMIHHPPLPGLALPLRDLTDAEELEAILSKHQIHLALHGHNHRDELAWGQGSQAPFPVVGVPSASMADGRHRPLGRYNLYDIVREPRGWSITLRGFAARAFGQRVEQVAEQHLIPPSPDADLS